MQPLSSGLSGQHWQNIKQQLAVAVAVRVLPLPTATDDFHELISILMRDIVQFLENLMKTEQPVWITLIIVVFILVLAVILSPTMGAKLVETVFTKRSKPKGKNLCRKYFLNHPVYDYFSYSLTRLRTLDFGSPGKSDVIKDLLYLMFTTYHAKIKEFIIEGINTTDVFDFKKLVHRTILKAEEEYEMEWHKLKTDMLDELIRDYNTWHAQSASFARMAICNITNSEIYDEVSERMQEILVILETKFRVAMPDIEKGLTGANGKYRELQYKSIFF
jgi:hypothetical protein